MVVSLERTIYYNSIYLETELDEVIASMTESIHKFWVCNKRMICNVWYSGLHGEKDKMQDWNSASLWSNFGVC